MTDAPQAAAPTRKASSVGRVLDLALAAALAVAAALLAGALPGGSLLRAAATLPILLVVPGFLLIEACVPSRRPSQRGLHALAGLGASPPLVALLALTTVWLPGGFSTTAIIGTVTFACLGLAALAIWRRLRAPAAPAVVAAAQA